MARYGVNAQYIFKRPKAYRQLVGFIIGFLIVTAIEIYFIYSYCSYVYLNGSHDFISDLFGGFGLLFSQQSVAMPLHLAISQIFGNWLQLWWFNLVLVLMILLSVTRKGNFAGVEAGSAHFAGKNVPISKTQIILYRYKTDCILIRKTSSLRTSTKLLSVIPAQEKPIKS